jgi:hypothetical protein
METNQQVPPKEETPVKQPIIKEIKTVEYFDKRRYKFTFLDNTVRFITSVTTKLEEWRDKGLERHREEVGTDEANREMEEGGTWGSKVHHACFLLATGGGVFYEPPAYQTVGIQNEEVAALVKQNNLIRSQLALRGIPYITISDQYRFLQVAKFKNWIDVVKPEVLYAETKVYSLALDVAGRIDFLFRVKEGNYPIAGAKDVFLPGGIILPDVKSGAWSDKYWLQLAAYRKAVAESLGIAFLPVATVGIHLKASTKSGMNTLVHLGEEADHDFELYQHVAAIYDDKHKNDSPFDFEFEPVLLGEQAHAELFLGGTIPNAEAERVIGSELLERAEPANKVRAAEFEADLSKAKNVEDIHSPVIQNDEFLRSPKRPRRIS